MLHLTCEHCGGKTLVAISVTPFGMVSLGVLTDLDQSEARRVLSAEPVSADQVIAAHNEIPHAVIGKPWMAPSLRSSQAMGSYSWSLGIEAKPDRLKNGTIG